MLNINLIILTLKLKYNEKNLLINYWDTYYKSNKKIKESSFARFVIKKIDKNSKIIDIGCGNGRDSFSSARMI